MPRPLDRGGLTQIVAALGLIDEALVSHIADAVDRGEEKTAEELKKAMARNTEMMANLRNVLAA